MAADAAAYKAAEAETGTLEDAAAEEDEEDGTDAEEEEEEDDDERAVRLFGCMARPCEASPTALALRKSHSPQ